MHKSDKFSERFCKQRTFTKSLGEIQYEDINSILQIINVNLPF